MSEKEGSIPGYVDYQRREFCKDVKCMVQLDLEREAPGSEAHERIRGVCQNECRYTTYDFHHWLIGKGYLIVRKDRD